MSALGDVQNAGSGGTGVVQAPAPDGELLPYGVDGRFVAVPPGEPAADALVRHVPGDPDLRGARRDMALEQLPVGGDGPGRRAVQAAVGDEGDGARIGDPRPQQACLAVVVA